MENTNHTKPEPPTGKPELSDYGITLEEFRSAGVEPYGLGPLILSIWIIGAPVLGLFVFVSAASPDLGTLLILGGVTFFIVVNWKGFSGNPSNETLKAVERYKEATKLYDKRYRAYEERLRAYEQTRADWWFSLSGRRFEIEFSNLLTARGYTTEVTQATGDGGVDIRAQKDGQKIIIECKAWKEKVGVTIVRQLNGVRAIDEIAWVVGLGGFTDPAIEFAKEKSIQLYEYKDIAEWVEILKQEQ